MRTFGPMYTIGNVTAVRFSKSLRVTVMNVSCGYPKFRVSV